MSQKLSQRIEINYEGNLLQIWTGKKQKADDAIFCGVSAIRTASYSKVFKYRLLKQAC